MSKTFVEFIKTKLSDDSPIGDLANDISRDKKFPIEGTTEEIIEYLTFKTAFEERDDTFIKLLEHYNDYLKGTEQEENKNILKTIIPKLHTEKWMYYKEFFSIDRVYLKGTKTDIYKVYCVEKNGLVLVFKLKRKIDLNEIPLRKIQDISLKNTLDSSVEEAIKALENCEYDTTIKPDKYLYHELLDFLKRNR